MRTKTILIATAATLTLALGVVSAQQGRGRGRGGPGIPAPLKITIAAFPDGGAIPGKYGCSNGTNGNISPAIQWSGAPEGTQTIALILHDPDVAIGVDDVFHWGIYNVPASANGLPEGVPAKASLDDGAVQMQNIGQSIGYFNPCPPPPTTHHYLFEFYALDTKLEAGIASRADLMKAMTGHVKAKGLYVGLFHQ